MYKLLLLLFTAFSWTALLAQTTIIRKDPEIAAMTKEISKDSLLAYDQALVGFGTRSTLSTQSEKNFGIGAARNYVLSKFKSFAAYSGGRMKTFIDTVTYQPDGQRVDQPILLGNVMAILKGNDPTDKRIFIISGHLDSRRTDVMDRTGIAPGANDDGSGVSAIIECARVMSKHTFPATIIFVAVSGEEQGLLGATFLANKAKKEHWQVTAMLNNDMIGSNNSSETDLINNTQVRIFSEGLPAYKLTQKAKRIRAFGLENDGQARQLARYIKETGERYVDNLGIKLIYRNDRFLRGGDHTPFVENGFAAVRITDMNENFNHQHQDIRVENGVQYGDLIKFVDFEYLRKNTALNLVSLANLAKAPSAPRAVGILVKNLTNKTTLSWKAPASGQAVGYYVMIRETTSAVWQKKIFTKATTITIPYSKDNFFFAVQAVSESGNESLPVVPDPIRAIK